MTGFRSPLQTPAERNVARAAEDLENAKRSLINAMTGLDQSHLRAAHVLAGTAVTSIGDALQLLAEHAIREDES